MSWLPAERLRRRRLRQRPPHLPPPKPRPAAATAAAATEAAPAATTAPAATEAAPAATTAPGATATAAPLGDITALKPVPRNQTVNLGWSISSPIGVTNPWAVPGYTHQEGNVFMWEPLEYYGIFGSKEIPWLADSMDYNADFTQLTIKLNPSRQHGAMVNLSRQQTWPLRLMGRYSNDKLPYHADFQQFMKDVSARMTTP